MVRDEFGAGCLALLLASAADVAAAEATPICDADRAAVDERVAYCLDRIVVSARRREEPLGRVPPSVAVLEGDVAEGQPFDAVVAALGGLSHSQAGLFPGHDLAIRGISTAAGFAEIRPLTAYYFGDTPLTYPVTPSAIAMYDPLVEPIDLDRIELLRGPQGTHFGAHAMGGALRMIPNAPDPGSRTAWAGVEATTVRRGGASAGARAMLNAPFGDGRGALRSVAFARGVPGWIDDPARRRSDVNGQRHVGLRSAAAWEGRDRWRFEAGLAAQQRDGDSPWLEERGEPEHVQTRAVAEHEADAWRLGWLDADRRGDGWRLRWHTARFERAFDAQADVSDLLRARGLGELPPLAAHNDNDHHEWTHELRLHSDRDDARWHWLLGVFLQDRVYRGAQEFPAPAMIAAGQAPDQGGGSVFSLRTRTDFEQHALFGDLSYRPASAWEFSLGARAFRTRDRNATRAAGLLGNGDSRFGNDDDGFVPRFSLRHAFGDGQAWFATVARGYRPGGANDPTGFDTVDCLDELTRRGLRFAPRYGPDSLWNQELGLRLQGARGRWRLDATVFRVDWDEVQTDIVLPCGGIAFAVNGGKARSHGAEIELVLQPDDRWTLGASAGYVRARYRDDLPGLDRGRGATLPGAPRLSYRLVAQRQVGAPGWHIRLEHSFVDDAVIDPFAEPVLRVPGHRVTHLAIGGEHADWRWEAALRNVFDARIVTGARDDFLGSFEAVGMPRHLRLSVRRDF